MKPKEYLVMILLSALWGASFLFIKISSPEIGPILTSNLRVVIATITLALICYLNKNKIDFINNWRKYLILGALNAAIPFALICTAELYIDASLAAILNATTPTFTIIVASFWNKEKLTLQKIIALILGFFGVIVLVGWNGINNGTIWIYASLSILAALSYGFAGVYSSKAFQKLNPLNLAFGQQLAASIILFPFSIVKLPENMPSLKAILSVILLGVFCTAIGYFLYFYLIKHVGPVKTSTVTFLNPTFGIMWGSIFLHEIITIQNVLGLLIISVSILLINNHIGNFITNRKIPKTSN